MKITLKFALVAIMSLFSSSHLLAEQFGTYEVDVAHSKVGFEINHLVIATVEGKFGKYKGTIDWNQELAKTKVTAEVEAASIDTGIDKRDEHLRSPDFFDVAKYPQLKFVSKEFTGKKESFQMKGELEIHGVKKSVVFEGKYLGSVKDPMGGERIALKATTKINRKDFDLKWNKAVEAGPVVGDEVTIDLKIEAVLNAKK